MNEKIPICNSARQQGETEYTCQKIFAESILAFQCSARAFTFRTIGEYKEDSLVNKRVEQLFNNMGLKIEIKIGEPSYLFCFPCYDTTITLLGEK